jgi:hypothetical protein
MKMLRWEVNGAVDDRIELAGALAIHGSCPVRAAELKTTAYGCWSNRSSWKDLIFGHCLLRSRSCAFQGALPEPTPLSHWRIAFITRGIARDEVLALWQAGRAAA